MSAGPGDQSRLYQYRRTPANTGSSNSPTRIPKASSIPWLSGTPTHGIVLGDPVPDETGQLKFELLSPATAKTWTAIPRSQVPPAEPGEAAFAASNSCLAILRSTPGKKRPRHLVRYRGTRRPSLPFS